MPLGIGVQTRSPWEQFALRNNFGNGGKVTQESKHARRQRMQAADKSPRRKAKKKKQDVIKELYQSHFAAGSGVFYDDAEAFGDKMIKKQAQTIRGGFLNVNVFTESARTSKSRQLTNHIREGEYDIFMMAEIGIFWPKLDPTDQWDERALVGGLCDKLQILRTIPTS
jgi:TRAP-type C4-dicarboxylate transport system substrate-binding protein